MNITDAFKIDPKVNCNVVAPIFNFGALNWISMSGCHFAGTNSGSMISSASGGLNTNKLLQLIATISINLLRKKQERNLLNN